MDWKERITINTEVMLGKPVIRGSRLTVEFIIGLMAHGWTEKSIIENYPGIVKEDILACLNYAEEMLKTERVYAVEDSP